MNTVEIKTTFCDDPTIPEVFVDHVRCIAVLNGAVHIEFGVSRFDEPKLGEPMSTTVYTRNRLVMPLPIAVHLAQMLAQQKIAWDQQQVLQPPTPVAPVAPKH
jgi:hypothetical protein